MQGFRNFLEQHLDTLNEQVLQAFQGQTEVADIEAYLYAPLERFAKTGGKRHRPLICMLACQAVGGSLAQARSAALAIEHFQTAALIHDDIADDGLLRRGEPCMHRITGEGLAINCGDLALSMVTQAVVEDPTLSDELKIRVLRELSAMTIRTIEGQALDLGWARDKRFDIGIDDYFRMATLKTAHYSGAVPLACGAIIGGAATETIEALRSFGLDTGLAFQIQDDLLNLVGDGTTKDKDFRNDIIEGKRTLVVVRALEDPRTKDELIEILQQGSTDLDVLDRAVQIFEETGALAYAKDQADQLISRAKNKLLAIDLDPACRDLLLSMADFFVHRLR
ncbi:polyprenyl synthetase family protein [Collinsella ureilytica]|uniref:polyprenyl synthetase family protein n=1 Tax=Collinsella ureilytica TaxID=2869515 RepID=UPI00352F25AA